MPSPEPVSLNEADLEESFSHASGPGGQNVNKVATRVTLTHLPTGISVSVQDSRSQAENRRLARERLARLLSDRESAKRQAAIDAREKMRRQKRPRPKAVKRAFRESKRRRAEIKSGRGRAHTSEN
ncbi:MAG TPA: peptide chain release factor-like protein [Opitutaceae bacterium]